MPLRLPIRAYAFLSREKSLLLLLCVILLLIGGPLIEEVLRGSGAIFDVLWLLVIFSAIFHRAKSRLVTAFVIVLSVTWLGLTTIPNPFDKHISAILAAAILSFTIVILLKKIFTAPCVNRDVLFSALTVYLLLGVIWSVLYSGMFYINPEAFAVSEVDLKSIDTHFVYYSFVTLTTLGYGDILPLSPTARILSVAESVTGVLYIATLIARLVAAYERSNTKN